MAALLGVERGSAAAPRQPALVMLETTLLHSTTACQNQPNTELASVHRHTRTQILDES